MCLCACPCPNWECNCSLYFCSLHNTGYYPVSTALSLTPPPHSLHFAQCVTFRSYFPNRAFYVTILTPSPHFLHLTVSLWPVYMPIRCAQFLAMLSIYLYLRGGGDKSLARPTSRCLRTELIVSLERGVCSCANLQVFSCYRG